MYGSGGSEFIYDQFVDLMSGGFSENQALKLISLMTACSDWSDGMREGGAFEIPEIAGEEED